MGYAYIARDQGALHFVTFTVHQSVDVFTRAIYVEELLKNLKFCQVNKGLEIYAWVIMSNHCHLIIRASQENLSSIIRDFKKFTAKRIYLMIEESTIESRKQWLLKTLSYEGRIWFWEAGYHGKEILNEPFYENKVGYIHMNPVKAGLVKLPQDYNWSSAVDFESPGSGLLSLHRYR